MPRRTEPAAAATIQDQLTSAAHIFAREILKILSASTLSDLTALARQHNGVSVPAVVHAAPIAAPLEPAEKPRKRVTHRTSSLRRIAGTKPVPCPAPNCDRPGVRSKMNFCNEHASSLNKGEKLKYRAQQKAQHIADQIKLPEAQPSKKPVKKKK